MTRDLQPPIETERDAARYLEGLIDREKTRAPGSARVDLAPIRALCLALGNPERALRAIHVAGSKGKGSVSLLCEALLRECGLSVGTYTSPHLARWTERFRIGGREVDGVALAGVISALRPHIDALRASGPEPSFFDAATAAAFLLFRDARVDAAVIEVGLGGRLDSTNVVSPAVTCISSIELEHTEILGDTLAAIAREKAGIAKPGVPLVVGALPDEAMRAVEARAAEVGAPLVALGRDFSAELLDERPDALRLRIRDAALEVECELATPGAHQVSNAALAFACARRAGVAADAALADAPRRAWARLRLPARIEWLSRAPAVIVDSAHTIASARSLAALLARIPRRRAHLVLSVSADKDVAGILAELLPQADLVTVTRAEPSRSLAPEQVAAAVRAAAAPVELRVVPNPHLALRAAREVLAADDLLVATGSVYLAGIAREVLRDGDRARDIAVTRGNPANSDPALK
jgi:dihydrofolate synthase/folylpolyglutamate synthase